MSQPFISQQGYALCDQCRSMTSTLKGLEALTSKKGFVYYEFRSSSPGTCPFCQLLDLYQYDADKVIRVFAQMEPQRAELDLLNQSDNSNSDQHPLQNRRIHLFYTKHIDPGLAFEFSMAHQMKRWDKIVKLENTFFDGDSEEHLRDVVSTTKYNSIEGLKLASTFDVFTTQDDPAREMVKSIPLDFDERIRSILTAIEERIKNCTKHHKRCGIGETPILPKRVMDVGTEYSRTGPKLYQSQRNERAAYIALSYCWGGPQTCSLVKDTVEAFTEEIPVTSLSQTIKDAVKVTRMLGYQYLWVDALCIIQDDVEDKISEINKMGSIYKNATLTIGAGTSFRASDGFLGSFPVFDPCRMPLLLPNGDFGTIWLQAKAKHERLTDASNAPLQSRGWTLQEFFLSPRFLYFNSCDLVWHCQTHNSKMDLETITSYKPVPIHIRKPLLPKCLPPGIFQDLSSFGKMPSKAVAQLWNTVVTEHTGRKLTDEADRLPALAGIAGEFQKISQDVYLAGIWKNWLFRQVGWFSNTRYSDVNAPTQSPSWSWVTFPHEVEFDEVEKEDAELIDCSTTLVSENAPLGAVVDGRLVLIATTIPGYAVIEGRNKMEIRVNYGPEQVEFSRGILWVLLGHKSRGNAVALIIQLSSDRSFVRIGQAKIPGKSKIWESKAAKRKLITLM